MMPDHEPKLKKLPLPEGVKGITPEKWDSLSAETQHSLIAHMLIGEEFMRSARESLSKGEHPRPVAGVIVTPTPKDSE